MSRCTCGCHDVEASVEKLQSLLAMESHLDEEMDELERLYQLDQLKYEWLMREGRHDLCDVIKEQMQKTESLLRMYSPILQDTCAEKEAHVAHILTMQRQSRLIASQKQQQQHQQIQQEYLQEQTHGAFPGRHFVQNNLLQCHSMYIGYQRQYQHLQMQYISTNTRPSVEGPDTDKSNEENLSSNSVEEQENNNHMLGIQKQDYRAMKRRLHGKILHKRKGWLRKKLLRCKFSGIPKHYNALNITLPYLKAKAGRTKTECTLGQFRHQDSVSKGIQRKRYHVGTKNIKLSLRDVDKETLFEKSSAIGKLDSLVSVSANTKQLLEASLSDQKVSDTSTERITNSKGKNLSCNYATRTKIGDHSNDSLHGNLLSILRPHQNQKLPRQDATLFLYAMPSDTLHKSNQCSKSKKPRLSIHDQGTMNPNESKNITWESRRNSARLNDTGFELQIVTTVHNTDIAREEQNSLNINDYISANVIDGFDFPEIYYVRE